MLQWTMISCIIDGEETDMYHTIDGNHSSCCPVHLQNISDVLPIIYSVTHNMTSIQDVMFVKVTLSNTVGCRELIYAPRNNTDTCSTAKTCLYFYTYKRTNTCLYACPCKTIPCDIYFADFDHIYGLEICEIELM